MWRAALKLTLYSLVLIVLAFALPIVAGNILSNLSLEYYLVDGSILAGIFYYFLPALMAIVYSVLLFRLFRSRKRWLLYMAIAGVSFMVLTTALSFFVFFCTDWFPHFNPFSIMQISISIGLIVVTMGFVFKWGFPKGNG